MTVFLTTLGLIGAAEMGDKTQLLTLALAARFPLGAVLEGVLVAHFSTMRSPSPWAGRRCSSCQQACSRRRRVYRSSGSVSGPCEGTGSLATRSDAWDRPW